LRHLALIRTPHVRLASEKSSCQTGRVESNPPISTGKRRASMSLCCAWSWVVAAVLLVAVAIQVDPHVRERVLEMKSAMLDPLASGLSRSAEGQWAALVSLGVLLAARLRRRVDWKRAGLILLIASSLSGLSTVAIKPFVGRARPNNTIEQGWFGPHHNGSWHFGRAKYNSFPSGHTATAAGFAFAMLLVNRRWGCVFVIWALGVAWSRVYLNVHFFSDTVASMFLCVFWAWMTRRWVDARQGG
jgi:membrane-associated phospholipid phosphatase